MQYICRFCDADLDNGDIFHHFLHKTKDAKLALQIAKDYGWTETNKLHFLKTVLVQPEGQTQFEICPFCKNINPLALIVD